MKRLISLNHSVPFGRGLNAIAHTAIGIGAWVPAGFCPNIQVLFADAETLRAFRRG